MTANTSPPGVVVYPAPQGEKLSEDFELKVGSQAVPVYQCRVSAMPFNQVWPGYQRPLDQTELASFAYWDLSGPAAVEIVSRRPIESVVVRPLSRGIKPKVEKNRITFPLPGPAQVTVEVNGTHCALHLFANPPASAAPDRQAPNVRYFGPGVHQAGKIVVESNQTVYLAGGAVVYGAIVAKGASNIRILGRGILDTSRIERQNVDHIGGSLQLIDCRDAVIDGIILRDPNAWCLAAFGCSKVSITNVKLIGLWRYNADGIDVCNCQEVTIRDSFIRSFDDSIVVKGLVAHKDLPVRNVLAERCVIWNDWGRALEIGAETCAPEINGITFRDCDVIRTMHIALDLQHGDRAAVRNVLFENIRVEVDDAYPPPQLQKSREDKYQPKPGNTYCPRLLVVEIVSTMWSRETVRGTAEKVTFRDISVTGKLLPGSYLRGFDAEHQVKGVTIENLRINGRVIKMLDEAKIGIGPFVENVRLVP